MEDLRQLLPPHEAEVLAAVVDDVALQGEADAQQELHAQRALEGRAVAVVQARHDPLRELQVVAVQRRPRQRGEQQACQVPAAGPAHVDRAPAAPDAPRPLGAAASVRRGKLQRELLHVLAS